MLSDFGGVYSGVSTTIYLRGSDMCQGMSAVETLGLPVLELTETPPEVLLLNRELLRLLEQRRHRAKIYAAYAAYAKQILRSVMYDIQNSHNLLLFK